MCRGKVIMNLFLSPSDVKLNIHHQFKPVFSQCLLYYLFSDRVNRKI